MPEQRITPERAEQLHPGYAEAALAGSVLRSLLYATSALQDTPCAPSGLANRLNELQGTQPGWLLEGKAKQSVPLTIITHTFIPLGIMEKTAMQGQMKDRVTSYRPTTLRVQRNMAYAGDTLDWELQFPDYTRAYLLNSTIRLSSPLPAPMAALAIYESLSASPAGTVTPTSIQGIQAGNPGKALDNVFGDLTDKKILVRYTKAPPADREIELRMDGKQTNPRSNEQSLALYDAAYRLYKQGITLTRVNTLTDEALRLYPTLTAHKLERHLIKASLAFLHFTDQEVFGNSKARYELAPDIKSAATDLAQRQRLLKTDPAYIKRAISRAREIMSDKEAVAFLMSKAKTNNDTVPITTPWLIDDREAIGHRLASLTLREEGVEQLRQELAAIDEAIENAFAAERELAKAIARYQREQGIGT